MEFILELVLVGLVCVILYGIYRYITGLKVVATEDYFQQNGIRVNYKEKQIIIKGKPYPVNDVTGIAVISVGNSAYLEIQMDDLKRPIHRINVAGSRRSADNFCQRVCVAIRKAGGPSFT